MSPLRGLVSGGRVHASDQRPRLEDQRVPAGVWAAQTRRDLRHGSAATCRATPALATSRANSNRRPGIRSPLGVRAATYGQRSRLAPCTRISSPSCVLTSTPASTRLRWVPGPPGSCGGAADSARACGAPRPTSAPSAQDVRSARPAGGRRETSAFATNARWRPNAPISSQNSTRRSTATSIRVRSAPALAKLWWHCDTCGNDWQADPAARARGRGCPACGRRRTAQAVSEQRSSAPRERSLAVKRPDLAAELHPDRNPDVDPRPPTPTGSCGGSALPAAPSGARRPTRGASPAAAPCAATGGPWRQRKTAASDKRQGARHSPLCGQQPIRVTVHRPTIHGRRAPGPPRSCSRSQARAGSTRDTVASSGPGPRAR